MQHLFEQLIAEVQRTDPEVVRRLRPGLPAEIVREKLATLPFRVSDDAVALYSWADGADGLLKLLPGAYFVSLDEALAECNMMQDMKDELQEIFFNPYFDSLRFLSDGSDGGYAFGRVDSPSEGQIVDRCIHAQWSIAYRDLPALLTTAIACRRQGVFGSGSDVADFEEHYRLAAELNPGVENWV
jgi:hypothetical protein